MTGNKELINKYVTYLQVERFYSEHTVSNYQRDINQFQKYIKKDFGDLSEADIYQYLEYLRKNYAENTVLRKYSSIKNCLKYLFSEQIINNYPCNNIKVKKQTKTLPKYLSNHQVQKLLKSVDVVDHFSARDQIIIEILYTTGIRISELINIEINDVDLTEQFIKVQGKGKKERYVPFDQQTKELLTTYLFTYRPRFGKATSWLIVNQHNRQLTRQGCDKILKKYGNKIGIDNLSPHMLRHSVATHLLNSGLDLKFVQELLGHENITTTQIYTHTAKTKIKKEYQRHHRLGGEEYE